jgi:hypothetical protein
MTLTLGQVGSLDKAGVDGRADRCLGPTRRHGCRGPEDPPCAHVSHAPALAPCDDLGVLQTSRGPPPRVGMSPPAALAVRGRPCTVWVQQRVPIGGQLSAGEQGKGVSRAMGDSGQQPSSPSLIPFADDAGQAQAPDRGPSAPYPGGPRGGARQLRARQRRFLGMHATPHRIALACAHRQIVPEGQHEGATVARHPMPPGTDRLLGHVDAAGGHSAWPAANARTAVSKIVGSASRPSDAVP